MWVRLESVPAVTYFARSSRRALRAAGLPGFWSGYFAGRAAPLGRVGPGPVSAAFFNFHPDMVAAAVPACWEVADPVTLTIVRAEAAAAALAALGVSAVSHLTGALPSLRIASSRCTGGGRVMAGANRALWPDLGPALDRRGAALDVAEAWQACTTLREHRGDGHVAALVAEGLGGRAAHLLAAARSGTPVDVLRDNRGWSAPEWEWAAHGLADRGLIREDGTVTGEGLALHRSLEATTDHLAEDAFASFEDAEVNALLAALEPPARVIQASGLLPFPNPMGLPRL